MNAEQATTTNTTTETGRNARGQFMPGNAGGPGNPFARKVAKLRQALVDAVEPEDIQEIAAKFIQLAKNGDRHAAKLLFAYSIGTAKPAVEPDRVDADEWDVYREQAPMKTEAGVVMGAGTPEHHLHMLRVLRPVIADMMHAEAMKMFIKDPEAEAKQERDDKEMEEHLNSPLSSHPDLAAFAAEWNAEAASAPSTNGTRGQAPPSTNGRNGQAPPSTNGLHGQTPPSTNGIYGPAAPSTNGVHGVRKDKKRPASAPPGSPRPF